VDENEALTIFELGDEQSAHAALTWLLDQHRAFIGRSTRHWLVRRDDQEDISNDIYLKLWAARSRFRNQGPAAFRGLLKLTAIRCCIDLLRRSSRELPTDDPEGAPATDDDLLTADELISLLVQVAEGGRLFHLADTLWLALDPELPEVIHTRQLLAAKLYYLDGNPLPRVLRLLGGAQAQPPLTEELLECWLTNPGVLRNLAYQLLYYPPDELAGAVLGLPEPLQPAHLEAVALSSQRASDADTVPACWSWDEVPVILARYRYCLTIDQILSRKDCRHSREQLNEIVERSRALFPFTKKMGNLLRCMGETPGLPTREAFRTPGLWQRLAFQYRYADELSQLDILERVQPPAESAGYAVTSAAITAWISGRRLYDRLINACRRMGIAHDD
jgi:DNA-directed RNA polymerase specialized sigma24 family protein